ncbi:MAG: ComF family protein [Oscillospiraceae bacterium]|jgi:ComF family protein|nr:ComF family protein [Oscillospiraceae bacterium]
MSRSVLEFLLPKLCAFCRRPDRDGLCADCQGKLPWRAPPDAGGVIAPLYYRDIVRFSLHRYKFRGVSGYADVFGMLMAQAVSDSRVEAEVATWVPCSFFRRWARGYDQSERLARAVAKYLGLSADKLLAKQRHAKSQTKMSGDEMRRENVRGAFKVLQNPAGKRILLIDDIYTSGATLDECRSVLLSAGAEEVICCAAASRR